MLTISAFISTHKKLLLNKKLKVRELDEESKGVFVAFVDEGKVSYDVHLSIDTKNELIHQSCDCDSKKPCLHLVFLAEHIAEKKQISTKSSAKKSTKKIPDYYGLIDSIDELRLKDWLKTFLDQHKELRLEFSSAFTEKSFSLESIQVDMLAAIKSTTNNRKNLDPSVIKNLLDLFNKINASLYQYIRESNDIHTSILQIDMVYSVALNHYNTINSNSKKYESYIQSTFTTLNDSFLLVSEDKFHESITLFLKHTTKNKAIHIYPLEYIISLIDVVNEEKRKMLFDELFKFLESESVYKFREGVSFYKALLKKTTEYHCFETYADKFVIFMWENEYNLELIKAHVLIKNYELAEHLAQKCIDSNYKIEHSLPYLIILRDMYRTLNDKEKYLAVAKELILYTYDFEDYIEVRNSIKDEEERKKYRTKIYTKVANISTSREHPCHEFCYKLLIEEEKYAKLLDLIFRQYGSFYLINKYFDKLKNNPKEKLLYHLLRFDTSSFYMFSEEFADLEKIAFVELSNKIIAHFDKELIIETIASFESKKSLYNRPSKLTEIVKSKLNVK